MDERPLRRAATIVCVRTYRELPEVLVVRRSDGSGFLPGYVAFPGGAVDADDEAHARRWFADAAEAPRAAALRELVEEVGIALTGAGVATGAAMAAIDASPPPADALGELCHWIAPPDMAFRFDARYYTASIDDEATPTPDEHEVADAWWVSPRALLAAWEAGEHKLYWPTWFTVTQLAACDTEAELRALRFETRDPTPHEEATMPPHVMEQE